MCPLWPGVLPDSSSVSTRVASFTMPAVTATAAAPSGSAASRGMVPRERAALLLLVVSGACFLPGALDRFVFPKLAVAAAGVTLALTVSARGRLPREVHRDARARRAAAARGRRSPSTAPVAQLLGRPPRYEGVVALSVYLGALVAGARLLGARPDARRERLDARRAVGRRARDRDRGGARGDRAAAAGEQRQPSRVAARQRERPGGVGSARARTARDRRVHLPREAARRRCGRRRRRARDVGIAGRARRRRWRWWPCLALCRPPRAVVIGLACGVAVVAAGVLALPASRPASCRRVRSPSRRPNGRALLWSETASLVVRSPAPRSRSERLRRRDPGLPRSPVRA